MFKIVLLLVLAATGNLLTEATRTVSSHISAEDLQRFQKIFADAFTSNDLQGIYYASINIEPSQASERATLCKKIVTLHEESKLSVFEKDYYLVGAHKHLKCSDKLPEKLLNSVYNAFKTELESAQELYYRVASHTLLNVQIDESSKAKIVKALEDMLKKDESMVNIGYAFNIAPHLGQSGEFLTHRISDVISYADEVDGKLLQFEGGLSITALVINGIFKMAKQYKLPAPMTEDKAAKFASYFLSRRSVQTAKGVHVLIEALKVLSNAGSIAPVCIQVLGNGQVPVESPTVNIAIVDLLGKALSPVPQSVVATIQLQKDKSVVAEKVQFVSRSSDKTLFSADLKANKINKGLYVAEVNVDNTYKQSLIFKVLGRVKVNAVDISIADSDGSVAATKYTATYSETLKEALSADSTQKLILKSLLEDKDTNKPITVHQVFMRLLNKKTDQEIIFIAEQDSSKAYRFEVDFGARSADFAHKSGDYELYLIVGDASISNSFEWLVANIKIKFAHEPLDTGKKATARQPLPEIVHQFRVPDKRPSRLVSDVFTGLCITPLVLLFIFWSKLGVNVSNFNFYPSTIGFHLGFGGILTLFVVFWQKLNMFETLRLLIPIVIFTFLCGNRLLRRLYAQRVSSSKSANAT